MTLREFTRWIAFPDCTYCDGRGWLVGGDERQQCPDCALRARRPSADREIAARTTDGAGVSARYGARHGH
jgi:hypothetical protein